MARVFLFATLRTLYETETGDWPIVLLTLDHETFAEPLYISSDATQRLSADEQDVVYGTVSRGVDYLYYPFSMALPSDEEGAPPTTRLEIDNVDRLLVEIVRTITTPPDINIAVVMGSDPDELVMELPGFSLTSAEYDRLSVSGDLVVDMLGAEPMPAGKYTPGSHPGAFR